MNSQEIVSAGIVIVNEYLINEFIENKNKKTK